MLIEANESRQEEQLNFSKEKVLRSNVLKFKPSSIQPSSLKVCVPLGFYALLHVFRPMW